MLLLYKQDPYVSPAVALFDTLIQAGEAKAHVALPVNLRVFLVSCLIEHLREPDIVRCVLALDLLESSGKSGAERAVFLKRAGDAALILAGLYPERALRLNVSSAYLRSMGQAFYASLAAHLDAGPAVERGRFYNEVTQGFVSLERVLNGARGRAENEWDVYRRFRAQIN